MERHGSFQTLPWILHKIFHKACLFFGKREGAFSTGKFQFFWVKSKICPHKPAGSLELPGSSGKGPDTGQKLFRGKGLSDIVICAFVQAMDLVVQRIHGSSQDHRGLDSSFPYGIQQRQPVQFRKHTVQDYQIIDILKGVEKPVCSIIAYIRVIALVLKVDQQGLA